MTSEYAEALEYFDNRRKKDKERYEKALMRGDQNTAAQIKAKMRKMEIACEAIEAALNHDNPEILEGA